MTPIPIGFGGYQPPKSIHNKAAEVFGRRLADRLGDEVRFSFDGNIIESGRKAADLLTMVENGTLSLCYFSTSYLAERVPEFALFDLPFLIKDRDQAYAALDGPLGKILADKLAACSGFRLLGLWDNGFRHFTNRLRAIHEPADCKGMCIRTLFSDLHAEVFLRLGFEPMALDVKDLVAGVKDGTIDAQENPLTNTYNFGIHNHHRHISLTSHFFGAAGLLCHKDSYLSCAKRRRRSGQRCNDPSTRLGVRRGQGDASSFGAGGHRYRAPERRRAGAFCRSGGSYHRRPARQVWRRTVRPPRLNTIPETHA